MAAELRLGLLAAVVVDGRRPPRRYYVARALRTIEGRLLAWYLKREVEDRSSSASSGWYRPGRLAVLQVQQAKRAAKAPSRTGPPASSFSTLAAIKADMEGRGG